VKKQSRTEDIQLTGYYPGVIGKITELHAVYYHENWGFDVSFETQVGRELSDFIRDFRREKDGFWAAVMNGVFAGAVAIDGLQTGSEGARLRWFIVDPEFHGRGFGSLLINKAIGFCREAGHRKVFLWTFKGLNRARLLYERVGFRLAEEHAVWQWGGDLVEQKFELHLG
jgi:GNAT superfamily N-acetyltransferase